MEKIFFFFGILFSQVFSISIKLDQGIKLEAKAACPLGWTLLNAGCYFMPDIYLSFDDAKSYCENSTTGELVTIHNEDEYQAVLNFTGTHSSGGLYPFWIGLVPDFWYPYWIWGDGTDLNYVKWYDGTRPKNNNGTNCVSWRTVAGDDGWISMACKYSQPFICKQPARICPTVTVNATEGNVTSPGYPGPYPLDITCTYILTVPDGNVVQMYFDAFELDYNDYIVLYDGSDIGGTADMMGKPTPTPTALNSMEGNLTSPNYPNKYNDSLELFYVINSPVGTIIEIEITDFDTEMSYDWLRIVDGPSVNNATLLDWSGDHTSDCPKILNTSSNGAFFAFYSDYAVEERGFSLSYRSIPV